MIKNFSFAPPANRAVYLWSGYFVCYLVQLSAGGLFIYV
ncbi:hypothetical protein VPH1254_0036 [Vibrio phage 1254]